MFHSLFTSYFLVPLPLQARKQLCNRGFLFRIVHMCKLLWDLPCILLHESCDIRTSVLQLRLHGNIVFLPCAENRLEDKVS